MKLAIAGFFLISINFSYAQSGQALQFTAANSDYVQLPPTIVSGSYTKEAWINPTANSLSGFPNIVSGNATALYLNNGVLAAGHATNNYNQAEDTTGVPLVANTWYHVAVTYDSAAHELKLYKNGVLVDDTIDAVSLPYTETQLAIGEFDGTFWDGEIDEVSIWSVPLTAAQIAGNMNCALTGDEPFLLAYYSFNQGIAGGNNSAVTTLLDSSANKCNPLNGTLIGFALTGNTSNWVSPGAPLTGGCTNIYPNINVTGNGVCISNGENTPSSTDSTDFGNYGTTAIAKTFVVQNTGGATLTISNVTITGTNATDFSVSTAPSSTIAGKSSSNLQITFSPTDGLGLKSAIVTITNNDGDAGTFTFAIQGNNAGQGKALVFNGFNNNYVILKNLTLSGSYTKEAWINTDYLGGFPNILSDTTNLMGTALFLNNGQLAAGNAPGFGQLLDTSTTNPIQGYTWYHVAVTYDSTTNEMKLYRDGALVADSISPTPLTYTETGLSIGAYAGGSFWFGKIDEVSIWNVARTQAQIVASMNCGLTGYEPGLLAYYNFTNGIAGGNNTGDTVLYDLSYNKCQPDNGILYNFNLTDTLSNWVTDTLAPTTCPGVYPNINVSGNSMCISYQDTVTSLPDNTNFGVVVSTPVSKTFSIVNNGTATLNIDSVVINGVDSVDFSITAPPTSPVLPGDTTSFTVTFTPTAIGLRNATVTIANNDSGEAPFTFAIQGTSTIILPVSLLSFNGYISGSDVKLNWSTSNELNNSGFEILRSPDGVSNWVDLGFVPASTSKGTAIYNFTDASPLPGVNTYRLKQINTDGSSSLSKVVAVDFSANASGISIYPNPAKDKLDIIFNNDELLNTPVQFSTITGRVLSTIILTGSQQEIDLNSVPSGVYLLTFSDGEVKRVIKQ